MSAILLYVLASSLVIAAVCIAASEPMRRRRQRRREAWERKIRFTIAKHRASGGESARGPS